MCGRTACALAPDDVVKACSYKDRRGKCKQPSWVNAPGGQQYTPAHNVAPGAFTPVLLSAKHLNAKTEQPSSQCGISDRVVMPMKWGLVPPWHHGDPFKVPYETNNCRAEGMLEKKTFKVPLMRGNRCVILADGFFEWKSSKDGKQPYYFYFPQEHLKSSPVKKELCEFSREKKAEMEQIPNMKPICGDRTTICSDFSQDCDLEASGYKSSSMSLADNMISKGCCEDKNEDESSCYDRAVHSACYNKQVSVTNISLEKHNMSMSQSGFVKQEFCGDSWTDICNKEQGEVGGDKEVTTLWKGHRLLTMAGVFDIWKADENAPPLYSYSVITVSSSQDMDWCHHRMPAILSTEEEVQKWLDFSSLPLNKAALLIKPKVCLSHHAVSKQVNNSRYQASDSVMPVKIGQHVATPSSKLMQQWLQSTSPGKRKLQESNVMMDSKFDGKLSRGSVSKKKREMGGDSLMMRWLKSGSPVKKN